MKPLHILVVGDDDYLREGIALLLKADGFVVDEAVSVTSAREAMTRSPDVVLLDVHLGREHSYELAAEVLAADGAPAVIVMSGAASAVDRGKFEALGVRAYLTKPFAMEQLARLLHRETASAESTSAELGESASSWRGNNWRTTSWTPSLRRSQHVRQESRIST